MARWIGLLSTPAVIAYTEFRTLGHPAGRAVLFEELRRKPHLQLDFEYFLDHAESGYYDQGAVQIKVDSGSYETVATDYNPTGDQIALSDFGASARSAWDHVSVDLADELPGDDLIVRFMGYTVDGIGNGDDGFYIDDVRVSCIPDEVYNMEVYRQRPDQKHDRDEDGSDVESGDLPSGW